MLFPEGVQEAVKDGADFIVNISNDVWFGGGWGKIQHFEYGLVRAIENEVCLVRSTNKGVTAIVGPSGRYKKIDREGYLTGTVGRGKKTFYAKCGNVFIYVVWIELLVVICRMSGVQW